MLVIELCCDDAQMCRACSRVGFQALALDARPLSSSRVRVVKFDLTDLDALAGLQQMILHDADRIAMLWVRGACRDDGALPGATCAFTPKEECKASCTLAQ